MNKKLFTLIIALTIATSPLLAQETPALRTNFKKSYAQRCASLMTYLTGYLFMGYGVITIFDAHNYTFISSESKQGHFTQITRSYPAYMDIFKGMCFIILGVQLHDEEDNAQQSAAETAESTAAQPDSPQ